MPQSLILPRVLQLNDEFPAHIKQTGQLPLEIKKMYDVPPIVCRHSADRYQIHYLVPS